MTPSQELKRQGALAIVASTLAVTPVHAQDTASAQAPDDAKCLLGNLCPQAKAQAEPPVAPLPPISAYKENYFNLALHNLGPDDPAPWEFKLGLKAPLYASPTWGNGLYFGYRMTGYWDVNATSGPFRDINHNPSLLWLHRQDKAEGLLRGFEAGIEHISNGLDNTSTGPNGTGRERSRAIAYALFWEPRLHIADGWLYQPRIWIPSGTGENPSIRHEWGLLWQTLTWQDTLELSTRGNPFRKGLASLKVHLPLLALLTGRPHDPHADALKLSFTVLNGYGDGLLEYAQRRTWIRAGLTFSLYKN